jgi:Helicase HerA, central domain
MLTGGNLKNFFSGGTRNREARETRQAWEDTQTLWRASPFASHELSDFVVALMQEAIRSADRAPALPILVATAEAAEGLLDAEDVGPIAPVWDVLGNDIPAAVEFREMVSRRRRWVANYPRMDGIFRRILIRNIHAFFRALPESCFEEADDTANDSFDVALLDLIEHPTAAVEQLFMLPYDDEALSCHVFDKLRERYATNLVVASGFAPTVHPASVESKLVPPSRKRDTTPPELLQSYLGGTPFKALLETPVAFHIPAWARFEHCHIVGGTGHGKTQLMQKMIHNDLVAAQSDGRSVVVIDSQGDLINKLVHLELFSPDVPDSLAERLVVIDPADVEFPAALNLFDAHLDRVRSYSAVDRERVLNGVIELYELFFGAFLGAELTQKQGVIFKYLARLMLAIPDATIHTLMKIMEDGRPFKKYMDALDGSARYFFETEFFQPSFAATKKQVLRRLWGVLSTPAFERMFTQPKNKLDLFEAMNDGKIILVSTAKDLLKREGSQLLGRFFIAMIAQAALERSTLPEHRRNPCFVYVDEAQEYFDDSIETILTQARKYHVGLALAHQTLDQLSPRLRSAILANTSMKCVGGVSSKDARALADEIRTTPEFIEGMKRRGPRSEFAVWVKNLTGQAIRLSVPLGFLERQPTLLDEDFDALLAANRRQYCGTLADISTLMPALPVAEETPPPRPQPPVMPTPEVKIEHPQPDPSPRPISAAERIQEESPLTFRPRRSERPPVEERDLGKGGPKHRYLQSLVKELAGQQGLMATIEAPLQRGAGQVDVLIERDGVLAAIEISVTTPIEHEKENLRKCLACDYPRIAVVLAKSRNVQASYRAALAEIVGEGDRERVRFLTPEELPDFIASLAPPPEPTERIVKGYRVKGSFTQTSEGDAQARQDAVARLIAKSLSGRKI